MWRCGPALLLLLSCSSEAPGDTNAHPVAKDSACHELLLAQCQCYDAELNCTGEVEWRITQGQLWTSSTDEECAARTERDEALCALLDTEAELSAACLHFRPLPPDEPELEEDAP